MADLSRADRSDLFLLTNNLCRQAWQDYYQILTEYYIRSLIEESWIPINDVQSGTGESNGVLS